MSEDQGFISVSVCPLNSRTIAITLNGARKVSDALEVAEIDASNMDIKVGRTSATLNTILKDGDSVFLVPRVKNGSSK